MPIYTKISSTNTNKFILNLEPDIYCSSIEEFIQKYSDERYTVDIKKFNKYTKPNVWNNYKFNKERKSFSFLFLLQNKEIIHDMYHNRLMKAESIYNYSNLSDVYNISCVETIRKWLNLIFGKYSEKQYKQKSYNRTIHLRNNDTYLRLFGAEDEIIRLYLDGYGTERLCLEFDCSADKIRDIIKFHGYFTTENLKKVKKVGMLIASTKQKNKTKEQKEIRKNKTNATRVKNDSASKSHKKYIETIRKKYNMPEITSISQVPEIREKQQKYRYVTYTFKTGETVNVQGYEPHAILELENLGYTFDQLDFRKTYDYVCSITNKFRRYFADIVIKETGEIIEVKSSWTIKKYASKNREILKNMLTKSIKFSFWVYNFQYKQRKIIIETIEDFDEYIAGNFVV